MWVFTNHGFYSIVKIIDTNPEKFWIRSRRREHLNTFFSEERIIESYGSDYQYRVEISKDELSEIFSYLPQEIDYTNFKYSIKDKPLQHAAKLVWLGVYGALDERERPMAANKTKRSWSPIKDRKPDGSRDSGLSSDTQGKTGVVRIEDWKRK